MNNKENLYDPNPNVLKYIIVLKQYDYEKLLYDNCEGLISKMILKLKDMIRY